MHFPFYEFRGTSYEIGCSYGESLKDKIHQTWNFYRDIFQKSDEQILSMTESFFEPVRKCFPRFIDEIQGVSRGSNIESWKILALNYRTELLNQIHSQQLNECTLVYSSKNNLLAQTWDWAEALEDLAIVVKLHLESGLSIVMLSEPGIIGKIGVNSFGTGAGLTFLRASSSFRGISVHLLLRAILECRCRDEVQKLFSRISPCSTSSITMSFKGDTPFGVEMLGDQIFEYASSGDFVHTNHYLTHVASHSLEEGEEYENSVQRYNRAEVLLDNCISGKDIKSLLADRNGDNPICYTYVPYEIISSSGTIARIIINSEHSTMEIAKGTEYPYNKYSV